MPSVSTVLKIAAALNVSIGELFEASQSTSPVVRADERPEYDFPDLGFTDELASADASGLLQVLVSRISPGGGSGTDLYSHGAKVEFVLVVDGELELYLGPDTYVLGEGDSATFPGDTPHGYKNPGNRDARVIWVVTPSAY